MTYRTRASKVIGKAHAPVEFRVTTSRHAAGLTSFDELATVVVITGAADLQTYATASQCRALANALIDAADDLEAMAAEPGLEAA